MSRHPTPQREISATRVHQWLPSWDDVHYDINARRRKPEDHFYLFALSAGDLRALSGISRRTTKGSLPRAADIGIQRRHDEERSATIRDFLQYGYPLSEMSDSKRQSGLFTDLLKPGWLPTAIVVNIIRPLEQRRNLTLAVDDAVTIDDPNSDVITIRLPKSFTGPGWTTQGLHPLEVIDGQHRLWAFSDEDPETSFQLPVVAFQGLDISWQAYLFWTINITPKRINPSLAFDLYPLLRTEDWLDRFEGHSIYREARAQELTEALWSHPQSPWHHRINMLGEPGLRPPLVTQAAWIRALLASYVKSWEGRGVRIGGLFGARVGHDQEVLPWGRAQQAAFLILVWEYLRSAIEETSEAWALALRRSDPASSQLDPAFAGSATLLNTDQGVRAVLQVTNDLCYFQADPLDLWSWHVDTSTSAVDTAAVGTALVSLRQQPVANFLREVAADLASFDWRTLAAPDLTPAQHQLKATYRGSGGYRELRMQLMRHLEKGSKRISEVAEALFRTSVYS
jgi:DGQHR domain-containing protein